jgi:hypothetical protein
MLLQLARWPRPLLGTRAALRDWITGTTVDFRVTPKGSDSTGPLPFRVLAPYVVLTVASALPGLIITGVEQALGFYIFASINALIYGALLAVIVIRHAKENGTPRQRQRLGAAALQGCVALLLVGVMAAGAARSGARGLEALAWGTEEVGITEVTFAIAGAGQGGFSKRRLAILSAS